VFHIAAILIAAKSRRLSDNANEDLMNGYSASFTISFPSRSIMPYLEPICTCAIPFSNGPMYSYFTVTISFPSLSIIP